MRPSNAFSVLLRSDQTKLIVAIWVSGFGSGFRFGKILACFFSSCDTLASMLQDGSLLKYFSHPRTFSFRRPPAFEVAPCLSVAVCMVTAKVRRSFTRYRYRRHAALCEKSTLRSIHRAFKTATRPSSQNKTRAGEHRSHSMMWTGTVKSSASWVHPRSPWLQRPWQEHAPCHHPESPTTSKTAWSESHAMFKAV